MSIKKIFLFAVLSALFITPATHGQAVIQFKNLSNTTGKPDTVSASSTMYLQTRTPINGTMAIQLNVKRASGAPGGTIALEASIDDPQTPTSWFTIANAIAAGDTLINGDKIFHWDVSAKYLHYRIKIATNATTQKSAPKAYYLLK